MDDYGDPSSRDNSPLLYKHHVKSSEPYGESRRVVETELSEARKTVRDLAIKIEEANLRAKETKQKQRKPKPSQMPLETEDPRNALVTKELEHIKQEMSKLKLDMALVSKDKKRAEKAYKASSSKAFTFSTSMEILKKEIQELNEEQVFVEIARIEALKERDSIEDQRKEAAERYETRLNEAKTKIEEIVRRCETAPELEKTLFDVNSIDNELASTKETDKRVARNEGYDSPITLTTITEEVEAAKIELATIKRERFEFMASMDVIRDEIKHVREETGRMAKAEETHNFTIQILHSKITREKDKLKAITVSAEKAAKATKDKEIIIEELKKTKAEISKIESEIELTEERLEAAMDELEAVKSSELKALDYLRDLINPTVRSRDLCSLNCSTITITDFEYGYITGKAKRAEEVADRKVAAAEAWVDALKAHEKEILMKIEVGQREIRELSVEEEAPVGRRESTDGELTRKTQIGAKSLRKSAYRIGNLMAAKRARTQNLRCDTKSASFKVKRREKAVPNQQSS